MADPITIAGLVLAVVGVIQGGRKLFSRLWNRLKAAFGGLRSQSSYTHTIVPASSEPRITDTCFVGALMTINQYQLQRHLTALMEENASLRNEAARRYLAPQPAWNPFGWSDDSD